MKKVKMSKPKPRGKGKKGYKAAGYFGIRAKNNGACGSCAGASTPAVPAYLPTAAVKTRRKGGIAGFLAFRCDLTQAAIDTALGGSTALQALLTAKTAFGRLDGCNVECEWGTPNITSQNVGACGSDVVVKKNRPFVIKDYTFDATFTNFDIYNYLCNNSTSWKLYAITCDYLVYPLGTTVSGDTNPILPNKDTEFAYIQTDLNMDTGSCSRKPTVCAFLESMSAALHTV